MRLKGRLFAGMDRRRERLVENPLLHYVMSGVQARDVLA